MKSPVLNCQHAEDDLKAFLDGELSAPRRFWVRAHLLHCPACRAEVQAISTIAKKLSAAEESLTNLAPELRQRILDALPMKPAQSTSLPRRSAPVFLKYGAFAAACALCVAVVLPNFSRSRGNARRSSVSNSLQPIASGFTGSRPSAKRAASPQVVQRPTDGAEGQDVVSDGAPYTDYYHNKDFKRNSPTNRAVTSPQPLDSLGSKETASETPKYPSESRHLDGANFSLSDGHNKWLKGENKPRFWDKKYNEQARFTHGYVSGHQTPTPKNHEQNTDSLPADLRRVHNEARLTVAVSDIEAQSNAAEQITKSAGGYVISTNLSTGGDNRKSAALELRVPSKKFDATMAELGKLGEVRAKTVSGEDITQQYANADTKHSIIASELSVSEARLRAALKKLAAAGKKNQSDPWELRAEVRRLRVEAAQARVQREILRRLSDLSAISLSLEEKTIQPTSGFAGEMHKTFASAGENFLLAARVPLNAMIYLFAYAPMWLPLVLFYRWLFPRHPMPNPVSARDANGS